jgi:uncharacterized protein YegP (UPF0339 family)
LASFEIFRRTDNNYGWRFKADNGETLAVAGVDYVTRAAVERAIAQLKRDIPAATTRDLT